MSAPTDSRSDEHVFLSGRPPLNEFLGFVKLQAGVEIEVGELANEWRQSNVRVQELERQEPDLADDPRIEDLPHALQPLAREVTDDPAFQRSFPIVPTRFALVDLDRVVVYQKHINLAYVEELQRALSNDPSPEDVFRFCMSPEAARPRVRAQQVANNVFVFASPSNDFRFLGASMLSDFDLPPGISGHPSTLIGLSVGYGSNYVNALHVEGRLILNNGSHRAYALRDRGVSRVPCLIQEITHREELSVIGPNEVQEHPERYLEHARPPLLKDYFDEDLRKLVLVPRKARQVRVTFGVEQIDVPG